MEERARGLGCASRVRWQRVVDGERDLKTREQKNIVFDPARQREKMQGSESYFPNSGGLEGRASWGKAVAERAPRSLVLYLPYALH